jgi:hypothetical protein
VIATQELLKWHKKHAARGPLIGELAKQQEKYAMQDPGTASQELAKWQEMYATREPETAKHGTGKKKQKETVKFINRRNRQTVILVIKNSQTSTM